MSEDYSKFKHISTEEVEADLRETREEKADYEVELDVLNKRPAENKVRIYMLTGRVLEHDKLIDFLTELLEYRNE